MKRLPELRDEQEQATDPQVHAALSASAGTGKTQVLTSRVFRLLLGGAPPESILCLTFTKAGAAAMADRIGARLANWVRLKDSDLKADLVHLGERTDPRTVETARQLFARILDAPGGIRIQTIHSFAQSLLAAFPAEAGIAPGFQPIEGRAADELADRTLNSMLAEAERAGHGQLITDVQALALRLGEAGAIDYLRLCARHDKALAELGEPATFETLIRRRMDLPDGVVDDLIAASCADDRFDCDLLKAIAAANRNWGTVTGAKAVGQVERWLALSAAERAQVLPELAVVVFTGSGDLRKGAAGQIKADPDYERHAERLAGEIKRLIDVQEGCRLAGAIAAGLRAGRAFADAYATAKSAAGVADFDDLIAWTKRLLEQPGMGEWVRYKLDQRIDHVLVDEAQDTNADQWAIIGALVDDFFTGASEADGRWRTLLTVGDFKQAIFGFQGTDPREFERMRADFKARADALLDAENEADDGVRQARAFRDLAMATSFRSAQPILDVVDTAIAVIGWDTMGLPDPPKPHRASPANATLPGSVELWPLFAPDLPDDTASTDNATNDNVDNNNASDEEGWIDYRERRYASDLAQRIAGWIDEGGEIASTGQPIAPGDILILVRSRGELASLIVARLFAAGVPVAGIDRLHLQEPLAVQDLLAAMTFASQPLDDLNLASLLVSPLFGWTQEQLLDLAWNRGSSLWRALRDRAAGDPAASTTRDTLAALLAMADFVTPASFLETVLSGPLGGRRKLYRRLSLAARDPIDELLAAALEFERTDIPSLDRFLAWFRRGDVEIARDPSVQSDEVRVMTVHGAKGLEAPVVIIADAHADPAQLGRQNGPVGLDLGGRKVPVMRPRKAERVAPFDVIMDDDARLSLEEHMRLLYVGMTRAIDRLVISGLRPRRGELAPTSWYAKVGEALERLPTTEGVGGTLVYHGHVKPRRHSKKQAEPVLDGSRAIPAWASRPAPSEQHPPRPLAPSAIGVDDEAATPPSHAMRAAALRGTLIHQLLERLAPVRLDERAQMARRWLERTSGLDDPADRETIVDQVCGLLSDPANAPLFGPGSLGEAPLAATLPDGRVIAGTADRLLIEKTRVSVIDFKTGRVPASAAEIPRSHRAQMEAYAEALRVIFPGREVRSALLYTAGPRRYEL